MSDAAALAEILELYCTASEQMVNHAKSAIMFRPDVLQQKRKQICDILVFNEVSKHDKVEVKPIGMNVLVVVVKRNIAWGDECLSRAGKEVLVKPVVQAIPTYAMSCFKFRENILKEIQSQVMKFWWCEKWKDTGIDWISWRKLCDTEQLGGLGLKHMKAFNLAMLTKQTWQILSEPDSLLSLVYRKL